MSKKDKRQPSPRGVPPRKEVPRPVLPGSESSHLRLGWRFKHIDHNGPWCFDSMDATTLCNALKDFETMTIDEVFRGYPGKDYDVAGLPTRKARHRLEDLRLADQTTISALRISGEQRLWGFRVGNIFHVIWWDPHHEVWPSEKKNT